MTVNKLREIHNFIMSGGRAAAISTPTEDARITEVHDGIIVTRPLKKVEYLSETQKTGEQEAQAQVWNLTRNGPVLQQESKAASVPVNKLREIHDFINGKH